MLGDRVVLKGEIKTIGIQGGTEGWEKGRVILIRKKRNVLVLLGGLLYARQGRGTVWRTLVDTGMLACGTELLQLFIDDRSALVGDVVIDMVGVGFAVLIVGLRWGVGRPFSRA